MSSIYTLSSAPTITKISRFFYRKNCENLIENIKQLHICFAVAVYMLKNNVYNVDEISAYFAY